MHRNRNRRLAGIPAQALLHGVRDQCRDGLFRPGSGFAGDRILRQGIRQPETAREPARISVAQGPAPRRARDTASSQNPPAAIAEVSRAHAAAVRPDGGRRARPRQGPVRRRAICAGGRMPRDRETSPMHAPHEIIQGRPSPRPLIGALDDDGGVARQARTPLELA